jgi:LysM domain
LQKKKEKSCNIANEKGLYGDSIFFMKATSPTLNRFFCAILAGSLSLLSVSCQTMPQQNADPYGAGAGGYGQSGYGTSGYGNSGYGNSSSYGNSGYGNTGSYSGGNSSYGGGSGYGNSGNSGYGAGGGGYDSGSSYDSGNDSGSSYSSGGGGSSSGQRHTVARGETLSSIAKRYGTSWSRLASHNGISNPNSIRVGQTIRIP